MQHIRLGRGHVDSHPDRPLVLVLGAFAGIANAHAALRCTHVLDDLPTGQYARFTYGLTADRTDFEVTAFEASFPDQPRPFKATRVDTKFEFDAVKCGCTLMTGRQGGEPVLAFGLHAVMGLPSLGILARVSGEGESHALENESSNLSMQVSRLLDQHKPAEAEQAIRRASSADRIVVLCKAE